MKKIIIISAASASALAVATGTYFLGRRHGYQVAQAEDTTPAKADAKAENRAQA